MLYFLIMKKALLVDTIRLLGSFAITFLGGFLIYVLFSGESNLLGDWSPPAWMTVLHWLLILGTIPAAAMIAFGYERGSFITFISGISIPLSYIISGFLGFLNDMGYGVLVVVPLSVLYLGQFLIMVAIRAFIRRKEDRTQQKRKKWVGIAISVFAGLLIPHVLFIGSYLFWEIG